VEDRQQAQTLIEKVIENTSQVIIGKKSAIELGVIALFSRGHILIEDVPGVGKTMLAKSIAKSTGCEFKRLQFTPDMLPSDITGTNVYNQSSSNFEFRPGPIMSQMVLVDEINRATPKTQSALLEAMEEHQISIDGVSYDLPTPFMILATQNPIEYEGTFPLPEAQLDRFLMRIRLGYPSTEQTVEILGSQQYGHPIDSLGSVIRPADIISIAKTAMTTHLDDRIKQYIVAIVEGTRQNEHIVLGASPRAALDLAKACQTYALSKGREYAIPDDVKHLAAPVLSHRIILDTNARIQGVTAEQVIQTVLDHTLIPGYKPN
jgi:MoxR-like ATPase